MVAPRSGKQHSGLWVRSYRRQELYDSHSGRAPSISSKKTEKPGFSESVELLLSRPPARGGQKTLWEDPNQSMARLCPSSRCTRISRGSHGGTLFYGTPCAGAPTSRWLDPISLRPARSCLYPQSGSNGSSRPEQTRCLGDPSAAQKDRAGASNLFWLIYDYRSRQLVEDLAIEGRASFAFSSGIPRKGESLAASSDGPGACLARRRYSRRAGTSGLSGLDCMLPQCQLPYGRELVGQAQLSMGSRFDLTRPAVDWAS